MTDYTPTTNEHERLPYAPACMYCGEPYVNWREHPNCDGGEQ